MFWLKKDMWKMKNILLKCISHNIFENQTFQRTWKFIMADFYEMDFMKCIVISVKVVEMYSILKSLLATAYWLREEGGIGWTMFLMESAVQCPYVYYIPPLLRSRLHLPVIIFYYFRS